MRPLRELNGHGRWTGIMFLNYDIDFESNARVVRLQDEPPEIAEFDSDLQTTQTVSLDTIFFHRITASPFQMGLCFCFVPLPHQTLPSPLPP